MSHRQARTITLVLIVFACVQVLLFVLFENNTATTASLHDGLRGTCYRLNVLRWTLDKEEIEEALDRHEPTVLYAPATDCLRAVEHPNTYVPPLPERITIAKAKRLTAHPPTPPQHVLKADP